MKYKGYEIRPAEKRGPVCTISGQGIFDGDRLISIAENVAIAKRAIDSHTKSGYWKEKEHA